MDLILFVSNTLGMAHLDSILSIILLTLIPFLSDIVCKYWAKMWPSLFHRLFLGSFFRREVAGVQSEGDRNSSQLSRLVNNEVLIEMVLAYTAYLIKLAMLNEADREKSSRDVEVWNSNANHCTEEQRETGTTDSLPYVLPSSENFRYAVFQYVPSVRSTSVEDFFYSTSMTEAKIKLNGAHLARYLSDNYCVSLVPAPDTALEVEPGLFVRYTHTPQTSQHTASEGQMAGRVNSPSHLPPRQVTQSQHDTVENFLLGDLFVKLNSQKHGCTPPRSSGIENQVEGKNKCTDAEPLGGSAESGSSRDSSSDSNVSSSDQNSGDEGGDHLYETQNPVLRQIILYCREFMTLKECEMYLHNFRRRLKMGLEGMIGCDLGNAEVVNPLLSEHRIDSFLRRARLWYMSQAQHFRQGSLFLIYPKPTGIEADVSTTSLSSKLKYSMQVPFEDDAPDTNNRFDVPRLAVHRFPLHWEGVHGKTFNALFFSQKEMLLRILRDFNNTSGKFAVPGASRHLNLLVCGASGTGKTSLVKAIARYLKRHIVILQLDSFCTAVSLKVWMDRLVVRCSGEERILYNESSSDSCNDPVGTPQDKFFTLNPREVIYLIEDLEVEKERRQGQVKDYSRTGSARRHHFIQAVFAKKLPFQSLQGEFDKTNVVESPADVELQQEVTQHYYSRSKLNMNHVLSGLNDVTTPDDRVVVLTTTCTKNLDQRLLQSGIVALAVHMKGLGWQQVTEMIRYYFPQETMTLQSIERIRAALYRLNTKKQKFYKRMEADRDDSDADLASTHLHEPEINPSYLEQICAECDSVSELIEYLESDEFDVNGQLF